MLTLWNEMKLNTAATWDLLFIIFSVSLASWKPLPPCTSPYQHCLTSMGNKLVTETLPQFFLNWHTHRQPWCNCSGVTLSFFLRQRWGKEFLLCTLMHQSMQILLELHYISLNRLAKSRTNRPGDRRAQAYCGRYPHLLEKCVKLTSAPTQPRFL